MDFKALYLCPHGYFSIQGALEFGGFKGTALKMWLTFRILYFVLRAVLAVILLSDISIVPTYPVVYTSGIAQAGLSPINSSVITPLDSDATTQFWWLFPSLMTDQAAVTTTTPLTCSGSLCLSYFLPGPMTVVLFDKTMPPIEKENFTEANAYIVHDAPGYQIDYSPVLATDPALQEDDCQQYGMPWAAIVICVKQVGDGFIGGRQFRETGWL
jgi:hypothetical protein